MTARARTVIVTLALCGLALVWEAYGVATEEVGAWTFSRLVWDLSGNVLFVFAFAFLMGHWFFPKSKCLHCGRRPYRLDNVSQMEFDIALDRYSEIAGRLGRARGKAAAGFPAWMVVALVLLASAATAGPKPPCEIQRCPARPVGYVEPRWDCLEECDDEEDAAYVRLTAVANEPRMKFIVSPQVCLAIPGQGCRFLFMLLIERPGEKWYCPKVEWRWAPGHTSTEESDCKPYEETDRDGRDWFRLSRSMSYGPGEHAVSVIVSKGKSKALLMRNVIVR